jgi:hypothetical protein
MARFTQSSEGCVFGLQIFHFRRESSKEDNIPIDLARYCSAKQIYNP